MVIRTRSLAIFFKVRNYNFLSFIKPKKLLGIKLVLKKYLFIEEYDFKIFYLIPVLYSLFSV